MAIERNWTMNNSDINVVGEQLNFDWNDVCEQKQALGIYGEDGSGYAVVMRGDQSDYREYPNIVAIFDKIFNDHPDMREIYILDNF